METVTELSERLAEYHVITKRWKSDLQFFKFESSFLARLKKHYYFTRLKDYNNTERLHSAGEHLLKFQAAIFLAESQVDAQLRQLKRAIEQTLTNEADNIVVKNAELSHVMSGLTQEYQEIKRDFFKAVENVFREMESQTDQTPNNTH